MSILILLISFVATLLSAMSGAGSAMITIPTWILLGFPLPVALAASQVNGALWTPVAARNYLRDKSVDWPLVAGLVICGLFGAYGGTQVVLLTDQGLLQRVFGVIVLAVVILTSLHLDFGISERAPTMSRNLTALLALPLGFYETFFGSGNGLFTSAVLISTRGVVLPTALGYYYIISFTWCCLGAVVYLYGGFGNLWLIVPSAVSSLAGAFLGSWFGRQRGPRFVKKLFLLLGTVLGLKLALGR